MRTFRFSADGAPRDGAAHARVEPELSQQQGLTGIIGNGVTGNPEIFLIDNDTRAAPVRPLHGGPAPPVRQRHHVGGVCGRAAAATASRTSSATATRTASAASRFPASERPALQRRQEGVVRRDVPDAGAAVHHRVRSGARQLTYTLGRAEEIGGDLFSLDYISVTDYPRHPTATDERHRIVAAGIYQLPAGFRTSAFMQLASGRGLHHRGQLAGLRHQPAAHPPLRRASDGTFNYKSVDLRLDKQIRITGLQVVELSAQVFNLFNWDNFTAYQQFIPPLPEVNPTSGAHARGPQAPFPVRRVLSLLIGRGSSGAAAAALAVAAVPGVRASARQPPCTARALRRRGGAHVPLLLRAVRPSDRPGAGPLAEPDCRPALPRWASRSPPIRSVSSGGT